MDLSCVMEKDPKKSIRRIWTPKETTAFLDAYSKRQEEFQNSRKKKFAMSNVLEDLLAQGVLSQPTTVEMLQIELKNLLRALKATADNNKRTGELASKAPFEEKMEEIFGCKPEMRNSHTINLSGKSIVVLPMSMTTCSSVAPRSSSSGQIESAPRNLTASLNSEMNPPRRLAKRKYRMSYREKRLEEEMDLKRRTAADRNNILADYTAKKIEKMDEKEKGKEDQYFRKERLFRELFQNKQQ